MNNTISEQFNYSSLGIGFLIAFCVVYLLTPKIISFGNKYKLIDEPDSRKQHKKALVRIGGVSIMSGFLISTAINYFLNNRFSIGYSFELNTLLIIICFVYFLIGLYDDIYDISPLRRLVCQALLALIISLNGLNISQVDFSHTIHSDLKLNLPIWINLTITIIWIVGIINAINWLDGLDGLASGVAGIICIGIMAISIKNLQLDGALLSASLAGCCIGFLLYNFYPAKILMGDSGSYLIGSLLAVTSLMALSSPNTLHVSGINNLVFFDILLLVMILPIADMSYVILRRIGSGNSPFFPDRTHIHHRLLNQGYSHKHSVILIYTLTSWTMSFGLILFKVNWGYTLLLISSILLVLLYKRKGID